MPKRTNEEGNEKSQSGLVYKKLDAVETVELRQQVPNVNPVATTQVLQNVVTWEHEPRAMRASDAERTTGLCCVPAPPASGRLCGVNGLPR